MKTGQEKQQSRSKLRVRLRHILKRLPEGAVCKWLVLEAEGAERGEKANSQPLNLCEIPACGKEGHGCIQHFDLEIVQVCSGLVGC